MDLFDYQREKNMKKEAPLASRMRPKTLDDFVGQKHIVGKGALLYRAIIADRLSNILLYGPPGSGKTTLAKIIANTTKSFFTQLNATASGVKDIKAVVDDAKFALGSSGKRTILFIDEIHRFNKSQQDALLPHVEDGTLTLIGATTENPYFEVNKALASRSIIFELKGLSCEDVKEIIKRAVSDNEIGLGALNLEVAEDALEFLADMANGDARAALNGLELAAITTDPDKRGVIAIDLSVAEQCIQKRAINYDKDGDNHYDSTSAFIKSMRGSDPNAAAYYLAKMLYFGEDPKFIARRIVICASEDVGNADPKALQVAAAAAYATDFIGMPECKIILSQAAVYVACAPKSAASVMSVTSAWRDVAEKRVSGVPSHLKDAHYSGAKDLGRGVGYLYAHDFPGAFVKQQYLPDELADRVYYDPDGNGAEKEIRERLKTWHPEKYS
ncbi:MAG: replication-associated recombination protein A [Clostridiales bacterium]|nr:replication-associated recombination protein A [Clostridiales bacterium]